MVFLRQLSRSIPRTISRSIPVAARFSTTTLAARLSRPAIPSLVTRTLSQQKYPAFSTGRILKEPAGESDAELIAKLEEEHRHEIESEDDGLDAAVENVKLLENGPWEIKDIPGEQEVVFTRKFGNEDIRLTFTVADLQSLGDNTELDEALSDEDFDSHSSVSASRPGQTSSGTSGEDRATGGEREFDDEDMEPGFPARVNVTIEKPGSGALLVQTVVQDGLFEVEDVSYFSKPELANAQSADKDWERQSLYSGPPFSNLDEDLQTYFDRYLEERGINEQLATIIPDYIQVKEQNEYVRWLENVKNFVAA